MMKISDLLIAELAQ